MSTKTLITTCIEPTNIKDKKNILYAGDWCFKNQKFIKNMRENNIVCGIHYSALHLNPIYNNINVNCTQSEKLQNMTVSLPMNENLSDNNINYIIEKVKEYL